MRQIGQNAGTGVARFLRRNRRRTRLATTACEIGAALGLTDHATQLLEHVGRLGDRAGMGDVHAQAGGHECIVILAAVLLAVDHDEIGAQLEDPCNVGVLGPADELDGFDRAGRLDAVARAAGEAIEQPPARQGFGQARHQADDSQAGATLRSRAAANVGPRPAIHDRPATPFRLEAQPRVGIHDDRVADPLEHRQVGDRVRVKPALGDIDAALGSKRLGVGDLAAPVAQRRRRACR